MSNQRGFIAVTSVLILSTLFLSLIIGIGISSIEATKYDIATQYQSKAILSSQACAEYAMMQIASELHYTGDEEISVSGETCAVLEIEELGNTRTIHTSSTINGYTHRVIVEVSDISPTVVIDSYKSVTSF